MTPAEKVDSVEKTLKLIEILAEYAGELSATQIAEMLDCSVSSTTRFLSTMKEAGYVEKNRYTNRYELTYKLNAVAYMSLKQNRSVMRLVEIANTISQRYDISVNINTFANGKAMHIYKVSRLNNKYLDFIVGETAPAYCTSSGKAFLSMLSDAQLDEYFRNTPLRSFQGSAISKESLMCELEKIRSVGCAICDEEYVSGVFSLSFPIKTGKGEMFAVTLITTMKDKKRLYNKELLNDVMLQLNSINSINKKIQPPT